MRPTTLLLVTTVLVLALSACAGEDPATTAPDGGGGGITPPVIPACDAACKQRAMTKEALSCKHGPWQYRRIRSGNYLEISCSVGGQFAKAEISGNVHTRWVETLTSEYTTVDLAKEPSEWPIAECFLSVSVYTLDTLNSDPAVTRIEATLSATGTSARVASSNPSVSPDFNFADSECERKVW